MNNNSKLIEVMLKDFKEGARSNTFMQADTTVLDFKTYVYEARNTFFWNVERIKLINKIVNIDCPHIVEGMQGTQENASMSMEYIQMLRDYRRVLDIENNTLEAIVEQGKDLLPILNNIMNAISNRKLKQKAKSSSPYNPILLTEVPRDFNLIPEFIDNPKHDHDWYNKKIDSIIEELRECKTTKEVEVLVEKTTEVIQDIDKPEPKNDVLEKSELICDSNYNACDLQVGLTDEFHARPTDIMEKLQRKHEEEYHLVRLQKRKLICKLYECPQVEGYRCNTVKMYRKVISIPAAIEKMNFKYPVHVEIFKNNLFAIYEPIKW